MEELKKAQKNLSELIHNQRKMGLTVSGLEEVQDQLNNHKKQLLLHNFSQRRELLNSFIEWAAENKVVEQQNTNEEIVDNYLKTIL